MTRDPAEPIFLFDVDNTLLDNDQAEEDYGRHLEERYGKEGCDRFWAIFETLRNEGGFADYLGTLQRFRLERLDSPDVLELSAFFLEYPFADRVYPGAFDALAHANALGRAVILSDGDGVFQPHKIRRSGLWDAVVGRVLIYVHKERMLKDVERLFPAAHYVMVDDKPLILAAMKEVWGARLTTVFPHQGHYARASRTMGNDPRADIALEHIAELVKYRYSDFVPAA
jgi:FMN phosphatase YigB (HAD superfamily)